MKNTPAEMLGIKDSPPMKPDIEKYRRYVDHFDLSEKQKIDLINTVWRIMQGFVDRAFGIDAVQQAMNDKALENSKRDIKLIECSKQPKQEKPLSETFKQKR